MNIRKNLLGSSLIFCYNIYTWNIGGIYMSFRFCSLSSGSSGNCQFIEAGDTRILVDSGFSGKRIENLLSSINIEANTIDYILLTHEHIDHIRGAGVLSRRYDIPLVANQGTWEGMEASIGEIEDKNIKVFTTDIEFYLRDIAIRGFDIFHDAKEPVGYNIFYKNKKISIITDTGRVNMNIEENLKDSNLCLLEANHDTEMLMNGRYPYYLKERIRSEYGHLSNLDAGRVLENILKENKETILLGHLSKDNNNPHLAKLTIDQYLEELGLDLNSVDIDLTHRDRPTKIYEL